MNREIRFRFWLSHTGKMTYDHKLQDVGNVIKEFTDDIIPLQFTGLKDKNGVDIFEGDVLGELCVVDGKEVLSAWPVVWDYSEWALDCSYKKDRKYLYPIHHFDLEIMEVRGNICESPELIEK